MSKKNSERLIMIIILFAISVLIIVISNLISKNREQSNMPDDKEPSPTATVTVNPTPEPTPTMSPTPSPTVSPTPDPYADFVIPVEADVNELIAAAQNNPHKGMFEPVESAGAFTAAGMDYFNFYNGLRRFESESGTLDFSQEGTITFTDAAGAAKTNHISAFADLKEYFSGIDTSENADWFFIGALSSDEYIYAVYDYWGKDELTLIFRMDKKGENITLVYGCFYHEPELSGIFTATQENLYCVYTTYGTSDSSAEASILQSDIDGNNTRLLVSFPTGYSVHNLYPYGEYLYFFLTDSKGNTDLMRYSMTKLELSYVAEKCNAADFLYIFNDFALTGVTGNNGINYYSIKTGQAYTLKAASSSSLHIGNLMTDGTTLYVPVFAWAASADTSLVPLDLENAKPLEAVKLDSAYYYVAGIAGNRVYAENGPDYKIYSLNFY